MLGMHYRDSHAVRQLTRETRQLTDHTFGVNFILRPELRQEDIYASKTHLAVSLGLAAYRQGKSYKKAPQP